MMKTTKILAAAVASAMMLGVAAPAAAQDRPSYELPAIQVAVLQSDLHQQAMQLYEYPARWVEAADLHKRAADALPRNDAGQFFGYDRAAILYFHAGEFADSRRAMERAAQVAEATGDMYTAANTYVDAAFVAIAEGFAGKKREFVREAQALTASEVLTEEERADILTRIEGAPAGPRSAQVALAVRLGSPTTWAAD